MPAWLGVFRILLFAFGLVFYAGWGLTVWLVPERFRARVYLLTPFVGLFLIDGLAHLTSYAGLPGRTSIWIAAGVATVFNAIAIASRRNLRFPNRFELSLAACALPALLLGVAPIMGKAALLPIGDSNADPTSYSAATGFLRDFGMRRPISISPEHPIRVPVFGILHTTSDRLGFEFFQVDVNILSGTTPPQTFSVICAFGLFLWAVAAGSTGALLLPAVPAAALLAALLFSVSAFPLWIAYGGYGSQVLGMGLLIMAFNAWVVAFEERAWRAVVLAGVLSAGVAGIYSDCLPYLFLTTLSLALAYTVFVWGPLQWRQTAAVLAGGATVSFLANPIGWSRAVPHVIAATTYPSAGNVAWTVDLRQVAGAVPFDRQVTHWFGDGTSALWLVVAVMIFLAAYGFVGLSDRSALIAACFVVPHLASLGFLYWHANPYGYFKAWSIGAFIYSVLVAAGLTMSRHTKHWPAVARPAGVAALVLIAACLIFSSGLLARSMPAHFACTPAIAELENWVAAIDPKEEIYVFTGELSPVSVFWVAYYLREHPARFDVPIIYTSNVAQPFRGEPWVIQYRNAKPADAAARAIGGVIRENDSFRLLSSRAQR